MKINYEFNAVGVVYINHCLLPAHPNLMNLLYLHPYKGNGWRIPIYLLLFTKLTNSIEHYIIHIKLGPSSVEMEATFLPTQVELQVRSMQVDSSFATVGWRQL